MRISGVGRPPKMGRDAAIYIAKKWRTQCVGDSATEADKWIVSHWAEITPHGEPVGISESAHVRAAVRRAEKTWLAACEFQFNSAAQITMDTFSVMDPGAFEWLRVKDLGVDYETDGCAVLALESFVSPHEYFVRGTQRACMWMKGMRAVRMCRTIPINDPASNDDGISLVDRKGVTAVAAGIAEYVGLLQLREVKRLHRGR